VWAKCKDLNTEAGGAYSNHCGLSFKTQILMFKGLV
jgi:hypothetical protein